VEHRTADLAGTRTGRETGGVPALLLKAYDALREATRLVTVPEGAETETRVTSYARSLSALWRETEDITSLALGGPSREADRRSVLAALYVRGDTGRMALLIEQVGDIAVGRRAQPLAEPVRAPVRELGDACLHLMAQAHDVLRLSGPPAVLDQGLADITARQRRLSRALLTDDLACSVRDAADAAVLGRCHEECAWRTVALARTDLQVREAAARR